MFIWGVLSMAYTIGTGIGSWGLNKTVNWGKGYYKLCMVDWYRSHWNFNIRCIVVVSSKMEDVYK